MNRFSDEFKEHIAAYRSTSLLRLAKELRKNARMESANIAILQALDYGAIGAPYQRAKWLWQEGLTQHALSYLKSVIGPSILDPVASKSNLSAPNEDLLTGKMKLRLLQWVTETQCLNSSAIAASFTAVHKEFP
jgi:hypothetical protein